MSNDFPFLEINDFYAFPDPLELSDDEGIVGVGGNLSPGMLFSAYYQGCFPWYDEEPILWWSLNPRLILLPKEIKVTKSMLKLFKKKAFKVTIDTCFIDVISGCRKIERKHEDGTWITDEIVEAYTALHNEGFAHSVEVWNDNGVLVGGLYGVSIGNFFAGESMFALESNSSKYGFITLALFLKEKGFEFIDCQQETPHLMSLGAKTVSRNVFYELLKEALNKNTYKGNWSILFEEFESFDPIKSIIGV